MTVKNPEALSLLRKGRERLSDINNWCPRGPKEGENKFCAVITIRVVAGLTLIVSEFDWDNVCQACDYLAEAVRKLHNVDVRVVDLNDGLCPPFTGVPDEDRHRMILEVYDTAISLAQQDLTTGG